VPAANQFALTDDLRELIKLVASTDLTEVNIEQADWKVQIKREKAAVVEYIAPPVAARGTQAVANGAASPVPALAAPASAPEENYHKVTAPMVGIFYRSPDPKARPFVQDGEMVEKGQVIGIIEAMKIMNEITSEYSGRCVRINVENGQPVEYGQTLLLLEPV
jgi:acetyl-CoA carboxylase biotin carboxyl carrier protein